MKPVDVYWHCYRRNQIKPEVRGRLVYLLEIPALPGFPVLRHVFDPTGRDFPANTSRRITALLSHRSHGIIYDGVSKGAVIDVLLLDPRIRKEDVHFAEYNRGVICISRRFFLTNPACGITQLPPRTLQLLAGELVAADNLRLHI